MIKKILLLFVAVATSIGAGAQIKDYYLSQEGKTYTYKVSSRSPMGEEKSFIENICQKNSKGETVLTVTSLDRDSKPIPDGKHEVVKVITEEGYVTDFKESAKSMLSKFESYEVLDSELYIMPLTIAPGQKFKDCSMKFKGTIQGMELDVTYTFTDRKTSKNLKEIKVEAGEYSAIEYTYTIEVDMGIQTVNIDMVEYYVEGVGCVKQAMDTMNGMATTTMELISIK